jgi:chromate reductase, NAD(P)H dehydrogenase (quinone)
MDRNVAVLVGSLRKESFNRKLARAAIELAPPALKLDILEIGQLPLYNADLEADLPAAWVEFRQRLRAALAVLFVTPEYNRSVPGVLKNAIDVASRPKETSVVRGKPAAVISVSIGAIGGFGANHHLRQSLVFLNMPALPEEAYIGQAASLFDEQGKLTKPDTREFVGKFLAAFDRWIDRFGDHSSA